MWFEKAYMVQNLYHMVQNVYHYHMTKMYTTWLCGIPLYIPIP